MTRRMINIISSIYLSIWIIVLAIVILVSLVNPHAISEFWTIFITYGGVLIFCVWGLIAILIYKD